MRSRSLIYQLICLSICLPLLTLLVAGFLAGCASTPPTPAVATSPLAAATPAGGGITSPVATATAPSGALTSPLVPTATTTPTPAPATSAARVVVLHTNDNWGETEPCG